MMASTSWEIDAAFAAFLSWLPEALLVGLDPLFNTERAQLVTLAARSALPASYFQRDHAEAGGLMSYGPDFADSYRQAGAYVSRILNGVRAKELPVQQPTEFELVIQSQDRQGARSHRAADAHGRTWHGTSVRCTAAILSGI